MAEMKVVIKQVDDLIPYHNNPRKNEKAVDAVAESIREFGFKNPIIIDRDNVIISGHTRRLAAIKLGLTEVPCCVADDMTDEEIAAFRLADNRVAEFATWDDKALKEEFKKIADFDFEPFGFDTEEIEQSLAEEIGIKTHKCPKCGAEWTGRDI